MSCFTSGKLKEVEISFQSWGHSGIRIFALLMYSKVMFKKNESYNFTNCLVVTNGPESSERPHCTLKPVSEFPTSDL